MKNEEKNDKARKLQKTNTTGRAMGGPQHVSNINKQYCKNAYQVYKNKQLRDLMHFYCIHFNTIYHTGFLQFFGGLSNVYLDSLQFRICTKKSSEKHSSPFIFCMQQKRLFSSYKKRRKYILFLLRGNVYIRYIHRHTNNSKIFFKETLFLFLIIQ